MVTSMLHQLPGKEEPPEPIEKHGGGGVIGGYDLQSQVANRDNGWEHTWTGICGLLWPFVAFGTNTPRG